MSKRKTPTSLARRYASLRAKDRLTLSAGQTRKRRTPHSWIGFQDKTLWDLLHHILLPLALGLCAIIATISLTQKQTTVMEQQNQISATYMRQQNTIADEQLKSQIVQAYMSFMLEIDKVFIENPQLRPFFFDGKPITPEQENYYKAESVAFSHLDFFDAFIKLTALKSAQPSQETQQVWENYMQESFQESPIMCIVLKKASDDHQYETQFIDRFTGNCRKYFGRGSQTAT